MDELVHLEVAGGVGTVTLDSPANRNALSRQLVAELDAHLVAAGADDAVRVVVLRSSGRVFCSGAALDEAIADGMEGPARAIVALQRRIASLPQPVVLVAAGPVRAGGLGLVGAADVVLAADSATFALTEVRLGLAPAIISVTLLERLGDRAAAELFLTGRPVGGPEAAAAGLVTRSVPDAELDAAVETLVADLLAGHPQGLAETKAVLNADLIARIDADGEAAAARSARLFGSDVARDLMSAVLRPPADGG